MIITRGFACPFDGKEPIEKINMVLAPNTNEIFVILSVEAQLYFSVADADLHCLIDQSQNNLSLVVGTQSFIFNCQLPKIYC